MSEQESLNKSLERVKGCEIGSIEGALKEANESVSYPAHDGRPTANQVEFYVIELAVNETDTIKIHVRKEKFYFRNYYKYFNYNGKEYSKYIGDPNKEYKYKLFYVVNEDFEPAIKELSGIELYDAEYMDSKNSKNPIPCIPYNDKPQDKPISTLVSRENRFIHTRIKLKGYWDGRERNVNTFFQLYSDGLSIKIDDLPLYLKKRNAKQDKNDPNSNKHISTSELRVLLEKKGFSFGNKKPFILMGNIQYQPYSDVFYLYLPPEDTVEVWYSGYYYLFINWLEDNAGSYMIILLFAILANFIYDCLKWLAGLLF